MKCKHFFNEMGICEHCGIVRQLIDYRTCAYCGKTFEATDDSEYCDACYKEMEKLNGMRLRFMIP